LQPKEVRSGLAAVMITVYGSRSGSMNAPA